MRRLMLIATALACGVIARAAAPDGQQLFSTNAAMSTARWAWVPAFGARMKPEVAPLEKRDDLSAPTWNAPRASGF